MLNFHTINKFIWKTEAWNEALINVENLFIFGGTCGEERVKWSGDDVFFVVDQPDGVYKIPDRTQNTS